MFPSRGLCFCAANGSRPSGGARVPQLTAVPTMPCCLTADLPHPHPFCGSPRLSLRVSPFSPCCITKSALSLSHLPEEEHQLQEGSHFPGVPPPPTDALKLRLLLASAGAQALHRPGPLRLGSWILTQGRTREAGRTCHLLVVSRTEGMGAPPPRTMEERNVAVHPGVSRELNFLSAEDEAGI